MESNDEELQSKLKELQENLSKAEDKVQEHLVETATTVDHYNKQIQVQK